MKAIMRDEREMKDSGIEWIGNIPATWNIERMKNQFVYNKGLNITKADLVDEGVAVISYGQIHAKNNTGTTLNHEFLRYISPDNIAINDKSLLNKGDIIFADTSEDYDGLGNAAYMDSNNETYAGYHTVIARPKNIDYSKYFAYLFKSDAWREQLRVRASGIKVFSVTQRMLNDVTLIMPDKNVIRPIISFLDERCSKIDAIIAEAKASIEEYESWKQSVIAEKTTKGLDKKCNLKDSGFIWMGKIPEHWELRPFRNILKERNEKNNPIKSKERLSLSIDKGVTLYAEKTTNLDRFKDDFTAYKLAYKGDLVMNSMNMIVGASGVSEYFGCVSPVYYTYYDDTEEHITAKYCEYLFRSRMLMRVLHSMGRGIYSIDRGDDRVNTCRLKISRNDLRTLILPLPPLKEQYEIVDYLDTHIAKVDELISEKQSLIENLESYKKSLIYEVVTGKRKVVE